MKLRLREKPGFTLIELLVVVSIIGVLITLVAVTVLPVQRKSRDSKRKADVNLVLSGLGLFNADFKVYPNYTFYLGTNASDTGAVNSNFGLESDIPTCNGNLGGGDTSTFTSTSADVSTAELTAAGNQIKLKSGFVSVNNFLICLKYLDKLVQDPSATADVDKYHYRVNYDYSEFLVGAKLENTNDQDARVLLGTGAKRYWIGNGINSRQLDDDSDVNAFYPGVSGTTSDGQYFYQCQKVGSGGADLDLIMGANPFVLEGSTWKINTGGTSTTCDASQGDSSRRVSY